MLTMQQVIQALTKTGKRLDWKSEVEVILAGAAACMLTGVLRESLTTVDCDVLEFNPPQVRDAVIRAAEETATEMQLPRSWLNDSLRDLEDAADMLPVSWQQRLQLVGVFGKLRVRALGRLDLLASKVYAGRAKDRQHLAEMGVTREEIAFLRDYLQTLHGSYRRRIDAEKIAKAEAIVDALAEETGSP